LRCDVDTRTNCPAAHYTVTKLPNGTTAAVGAVRRSGPRPRTSVPLGGAQRQPQGCKKVQPVTQAGQGSRSGDRSYARKRKRSASFASRLCMRPAWTVASTMKIMNQMTSWFCPSRNP